MDIIETRNCLKCNAEFEAVFPRHYLKSGKDKKYCSRKCSNSRTWSNADKELKRQRSLSHYDKIGRVELHTKICKTCCGEYKTKHAYQVFCSHKCVQADPDVRDKTRAGGKKSAELQGDVRRSKNEKYFAELCADHFKMVLTNKPMFNGWDADVIIEDIKTAVMWNGVWHYKKITKKHSVKQVQNRDRIKIKEIKNAGYVPYVIKDMGKHNKAFVEKEFNKFIADWSSS